MQVIVIVGSCRTGGFHTGQLVLVVAEDEVGVPGEVAGLDVAARECEFHAPVVHLAVVEPQ